MLVDEYENNEQEILNKNLNYNIEKNKKLKIIIFLLVLIVISVIGYKEYQKQV